MTVKSIDFPQNLSVHMPEKSDSIAPQWEAECTGLSYLTDLLKFLGDKCG